MNRFITTGRILAMLTVLFGVAHEVATFLPIITEGFQTLNAEWQQAFTYFSIGCGALLILSGMLFLMLLGQVERHEFLVAPLVAIGLFALVDGILATWFMLDNPFSWAVLVFGIGLFVISMLIRAQHRKQ
jgi:VIT1/CCC1 family predicted Fe2+/Mn2+ transporter